MNESELLADQFEQKRAHLAAVAHQMLGSRSEAEDAVQGAWLRLSRSDQSGIENLGGWLTTVVARVCLDHLRTRRSRREKPPSERLPDPIVSRIDGMNPEQEALLADSVGPALLVVLETLSPAERLAFVLHDLFDLPFDEIAPIVGRSPVAARQLASRARRRVQGAAPAADSDRDRQREAVEAFLAATRAATSTRSSRCSIRKWCSGRIPAPDHRGWFRAPGPWPKARSPHPALPNFPASCW